MERRIPIPENAVEVRPSRYFDRAFFVMREPEKIGWIWVESELGTDGITYEIEPDKIVITTYSTHDSLQDGSKQEVLKESRYYPELIEFYEQLLELAEEQESQAEKLPFPPDEIDQSEEMRLYLARDLGLPETSNWEEVAATDDAKIRKDSARVLGLEENATMDEIIAAENGEGERVSSALLLGLPKDATYEEINEVRQIKNRELRQEIAAEMLKNREQTT